MPSFDTQRRFLPAKTILETQYPRKKDVPLTSLMPQTLPQVLLFTSTHRRKRARVPRRLEVALRQAKPLKTRVRATSCHRQTHINKLSQRAHVDASLRWVHTVRLGIKVSLSRINSLGPYHEWYWNDLNDRWTVHAWAEPAIEYTNHSLTHLQACLCRGHWRA
jgi:hypothetical protein